MNLMLQRVLRAVALASAFLATVAGDAVVLNPVVHLCQSPGQFAMTFDQGPSIYTGTILDALASRQVKATFHPVISYLQEATVVANLIRASSEGHTIGLSVEQSVDLTGMSNDDIFSTIDSRAQTIAQYTGQKPRFLRVYNYQNLTQDQLNFIFSKGYIITTYNLDSYDYQTTDVLGSYKKVLDLLSPNTKGAFISVQRDYIQTSVDQTPDIIDYVISKGYNLVTLDQCVRNAGSGTSGSSGSSGSNSSPSNSGSAPSPPSSSGSSSGAGVKAASGSAASVQASWAVLATLLSLVLFFAF